MDKAEFSSNSEENNTEWTEAMADVEEMSDETAEKNRKAKEMSKNYLIELSYIDNSAKLRLL